MNVTAISMSLSLEFLVSFGAWLCRMQKDVGKPGKTSLKGNKFLRKATSGVLFIHNRTQIRISFLST